MARHADDFDPLTWCSLRLGLFSPTGLPIGSATGFTVPHEGKRYLVTNWHVFSGRDVVSGKVLDETHAAIPAVISVDLHDTVVPGRWRRVRYPLYDASGTQRWIDHPGGVGHPGAVDVAALPIQYPPGAVWRDFPVELANTDAQITVAGTVHIIGFPVGLAVGDNFPIWLSGHIASDPIFDYDRRPVLLIDARTRSGMSGSPVILRTDRIRAGALLATITGEQTQFLGIYAGRVHRDADIGYVWRPHVLDEVLTGRVDLTRRPGRFNPTLPGDDSPITDVEL